MGLQSPLWQKIWTMSPTMTTMASLEQQQLLPVPPHFRAAARCTQRGGHRGLLRGATGRERQRAPGLLLPRTGSGAWSSPPRRKSPSGIFIMLTNQ